MFGAQLCHDRHQRGPLVNKSLTSMNRERHYIPIDDWDQGRRELGALYVFYFEPGTILLMLHVCHLWPVLRRFPLVKPVFLRVFAVLFPNRDMEPQ